MTNPNSAAQAPEQDDIVQRLRDQANHYAQDPGYMADAALNRAAADEIERLRREVAQLRAPVADERAAFEAAWRELNSPWPMNSRMHDDGRYATPDIEKEWRLWQARAALASAPVAGEAQEPVAVVGADFALYWAGSGPIAPIVKRHGLKVGSRLYAAPQASAEKDAAVRTLTAKGYTWHGGEQWKPPLGDSNATLARIDASDALEVARAALMEIADLADVEADQRSVIVNQALTKIAKITVAPQASAEAPKLPGGWQLALDLAIDAIENAAPMDWPVNWPAILHGLKDLRAALSQPQADKDGGQQRAGDAVAAEALAHLRTIANFGGTLDQAKELAARGVWRCAALSAPQTEQGERDGQD